jgi:hypothetical protein
VIAWYREYRGDVADQSEFSVDVDTSACPQDPQTKVGARWGIEVTLDIQATTTRPDISGSTWQRRIHPCLKQSEMVRLNRK